MIVAASALCIVTGAAAISACAGAVVISLAMVASAAWKFYLGEDEEPTLLTRAVYPLEPDT